MAKKPKKPKWKIIGEDGGKANPTVFEDCGGHGCEITPKAVRGGEVPIQAFGSNRTSPNAINKEGPIPKYDAKKRKAKPPKGIGCEYYIDKREVKHRDGRVSMKDVTVYTDPRPECQDSSLPCNTDRVSCPVQLFFREGKAHLRFCGEKGKGAHVLQVDSHAEAQRLASEACQAWENAPDGWEEIVIEKYKKGEKKGQPKLDKKTGEVLKQRVWHGNFEHYDKVANAPLGGVNGRCKPKPEFTSTAAKTRWLEVMRDAGFKAKAADLDVAIDEVYRAYRRAGGC